MVETEEWQKMQKDSIETCDDVIYSKHNKTSSIFKIVQLPVMYELLFLHVF